MAKITSCCVALFFLLATVAAVPCRINSIEGLPNDARTLLRWFAENVNVNSNGIWLNFDPSPGSYGSHHYGNYEDLLSNLPWGYQYLTIGNINAGSFPPNVRNANVANRVRIIIRVRRDNNRRADRVYITRHTGNRHDSGYDFSQTYEVPTDILQRLVTPARYALQATSVSNHSYYAPAQRSSSDNSILSSVCLGFLLIIIAIFVIIAEMQKHK